MTRPTPQRATLTPDQIRRGIERLRGVLAAVEGYATSGIKEKRPADLLALAGRVKEALEKTFGLGSTQYKHFGPAAGLDVQMIHRMNGEMDHWEYVRDVEKNRQNSIGLLNEAIRSLEEDLEDAPAIASATPLELSRNVFVVHGHDEGARESVARYLEKLGFKAIVLHEQASEGRTIIEKVEAHSDVGFAVVLLTPDDVGGKSADTLNPRARQNVILELGYFVGKLGRNRVCALKRGAVEVPSDFDGVVYVSFEDGSDWRRALAQELQAAGHRVDWNVVMGGG